MLSELGFTTDFEGFDVNTVMNYDNSWIPPGKTNQLRVVVTNEAFPTIVSLTLGAETCTTDPGDEGVPRRLVRSKWWKEIGDFRFPDRCYNGTALFKDEKGKEIRLFLRAIGRRSRRV